MPKNFCTKGKFEKPCTDSLSANARLATFVLLAFLASGCASLSGMPDRTVARPVFTTLQTSEEIKIPACVGPSLPSNYDQVQRNFWIEVYLVCVDDQYDKFIEQLQQTKTQWAIGSGILDLTFKVASSLTPSAGVKANYAAAGTLLTGSYTVIDKEAFMEKTVSALTAAMDAKRKDALLPIFRGMQQAPTQYPVAVAFRDLLAYQRAGSLVAGLAFVETAAEKDVMESDKEIEDIQAIRSLSPIQRKRSECLSTVLNGLKASQRDSLLRAIRSLDSSFAASKEPIEKLLELVQTKHRFNNQAAFDEEFANLLEVAGIPVNCN